VAGLDREEVTVYRPSDNDAFEAQAKEASHGSYSSGFGRQLAELFGAAAPA
jgi:hypothetical protein